MSSPQMKRKSLNYTSLLRQSLTMLSSSLFFHLSIINPSTSSGRYEDGNLLMRKPLEMLSEVLNCSAPRKLWMRLQFLNSSTSTPLLLRSFLTLCFLVNVSKPGFDHSQCGSMENVISYVGVFVVQRDDIAERRILMTV